MPTMAVRSVVAVAAAEAALVQEAVVPCLVSVELLRRAAHSADSVGYLDSSGPDSESVVHLAAVPLGPADIFRLDSVDVVL